jgi:predicted metalloprotease
MRWNPRGRSRNLEDRRGAGTGRRRAGASIGIGGLLLLLVLSVLFDQDFFSLLGQTGAALPTGAGTSAPPDPADLAAEDEMVQFVSFVLDDAQETWQRVLAGSGRSYQDAQLVLFRGEVRSGCGYAESAMGPFYCPADSRVYIDLGFYDELRQRFGAPGDFAQAYVLAHEIGHHIQSLTGAEERVRREQRGDRRRANELSVAMELQADCLAGVWGASAGRRGVLEPGDVEEGLGAAAAIGDDRIQQMSGRGVHPESFTHGSAAQRVQWLRRGLEGGGPSACETLGGF